MLVLENGRFCALMLSTIDKFSFVGLSRNMLYL